MTTTTPTRDGLIADTLTALGAPDHTARLIAATGVRRYLAGDTATPDTMTDLASDARTITMELTLALTRLHRAAGGDSCPDLGAAADHAAAMVREALDYAGRPLDPRQVERAIPCRHRTCQAQPGSYCRSTGGWNTTTHAVRRRDAARLTPDQQRQVVEAHNTERAALRAAAGQPLTVDQVATRDRISAAWNEILRTTR